MFIVYNLHIVCVGEKNINFVIVFFFFLDLFHNMLGHHNNDYSFTCDSANCMVMIMHVDD